MRNTIDKLGGAFESNGRSGSHDDNTNAAHHMGDGKRGHDHGSDGDDDLELRAGRNNGNVAVGFNEKKGNIKNTREGLENKTSQIPQPFSRNQTAQEFVQGVLTGMGYPSFAAQQHVKRLSDSSLNTVPQLETMDKKDWQRLGYSDEIITAIRKELSNLEEEEPIKKLTHKEQTKDVSDGDDSFGDDLFATRKSTEEKKNQKGNISNQENEPVQKKEKEKEREKTKQQQASDDELELNEQPVGEKHNHEDSSVDFEDF